MLRTSVAVWKIYLRDVVVLIPPKLTIVFLIGYVISQIRDQFSRKRIFFKKNLDVANVVLLRG